MVLLPTLLKTIDTLCSISPLFRSTTEPPARADGTGTSISHPMGNRPGGPAVPNGPQQKKELSAGHARACPLDPLLRRSASTGRMDRALEPGPCPSRSIRVRHSLLFPA